MTGKKVALSKNLKRLLKEQQVTVSYLARKTGMNRTSLGNYIHGSVPKNLKSLIGLAEYFNMSLDELVFEYSPKKQSQGEKPTSLATGLDARYEVLLRPVRGVPVLSNRPKTKK